MSLTIRQLKKIEERAQALEEKASQTAIERERKTECERDRRWWEASTKDPELLTLFHEDLMRAIMTRIHAEEIGDQGTAEAAQEQAEQLWVKVKVRAKELGIEHLLLPWILNKKKTSCNQDAVAYGNRSVLSQILDRDEKVLMYCLSCAASA